MLTSTVTWTHRRRGSRGSSAGEQRDRSEERRGETRPPAGCRPTPERRGRQWGTAPVDLDADGDRRPHDGRGVRPVAGQDQADPLPSGPAPPAGHGGVDLLESGTQHEHDERRPPRRAAAPASRAEAGRRRRSRRGRRAGEQLGHAGRAGPQRGVALIGRRVPDAGPAAARQCLRAVPDRRSARRRLGPGRARSVRHG